MSTRDNLDVYGRLRESPVMLRHQGSEAMTIPGSPRTALADHRTSAVQPTLLDFNECWLQPVSESSNPYKSRKPSVRVFGSRKTLDRAPTLVKKCVADARLHEQIDQLRATVICATYDGHYDFDDALQALVYVFVETMPPPPRATVVPSSFRYLVLSQSAEEPRGDQWAIPMFNGDCLRLNPAACSELARRVPKGFAKDKGSRAIFVVLDW